MTSDPHGQAAPMTTSTTARKRRVEPGGNAGTHGLRAQQSPKATCGGKRARYAHRACTRGRPGRKGGDQMLFHEHPQRGLAALHLADLRRSAHAERLARSSHRPPRRAIRRVLGQSLIGIGHRLAAAAEHDLQPARSP